MEEHIPNYITLGKSNFLKQVAAPDKSSTSEGELPPLVTENNQIFTTSNGRKHVSIQHIAHSVKYIMLKLKNVMHVRSLTRSDCHLYKNKRDLHNPQACPCLRYQRILH